VLAVEDLHVEREYGGASGAQQSVDDVVDGGGDDVWETAARTCRGVLGGVAGVARVVRTGAVGVGIALGATTAG
jgi:hypothetical protein